MRAPALSLPLLAALVACSSDPAPSDAGLTDAPVADAVDAVDDAADAPDVVTQTLPDYPEVTPPDSVVVEAGVRREVRDVPAPAPPGNPATGLATPAALNRVRVLRYRVDAPTPVAVRAVVIAVPGFLGGAGSFDPLARALVRRSMAAGAPVEVWALDRRSNALEDLRGMHAADARRDPEVAWSYYVDRGATIGGRAFEGFLSERDPSLSYVSEWGLASVMNDLRAVVNLVPSPREHVVLMGHSLGATLVEAYAAWDFDGAAGTASIAGLVMLDGVASGSAVTEAQWREGAASGPAGLPSPGVTALRQGGPWFVTLPGLGVRALAISEVVARRAALTPDAVVNDPPRDQVFRVLLGVSPVPPLTNAAAFGFAFDDGACPLAFARMSMGAPLGPLSTRANPFAQGETLTVPSSATETYRWADAPSRDPAEFTSVASAAAAWTATPSNFSEWYFPTRLGVDVSALGDLRLAADAWQLREGLRAWRGAEVDVPVLAISAGLVGRASAFDALRTRLAPTLGAGLPAAGMTRDAAAAFTAIHAARMTHLDPITADDRPGNVVPERVSAFVTAATASTVTVPAP